jgi:DNA-directed RNA polymerase subunit RPC12/RpoP
MKKKYRVRNEEKFFKKNEKMFDFAETLVYKYYEKNRKFLKAGSITSKDVQQEVKMKMITWLKHYEKHYKDNKKIYLMKFIKDNVEDYINFRIKKDYGLLKQVVKRDEDGKRKVEHISTSQLTLNPSPRKVSTSNFISDALTKITSTEERDNESEIELELRKEDMKRILKPLCNNKNELRIILFRFWYGATLEEIKNYGIKCKNCNNEFIVKKDILRKVECPRCKSKNIRKIEQDYSRMRINQW